jgi:hypothetical protein
MTDLDPLAVHQRTVELAGQAVDLLKHKMSSDPVFLCQANMSPRTSSSARSGARAIGAPSRKPWNRPMASHDTDDTPAVLASRRLAQPQVVSQQRQPVPACLAKP